MDEVLSGHKNGYRLWEYLDASKTARDSSCDDKNQYLLKLQRIMSSFTKVDHIANVSNLTQRELFFHS